MRNIPMEAWVVVLLLVTILAAVGPKMFSGKPERSAAPEVERISRPEVYVTSPAEEVVVEKPIVTSGITPLLKAVELIVAVSDLVPDEPEITSDLHILKKGDTICGVAQRHGVWWRKVYRMNMKRLKLACEQRYKENPALCENGNWQYRIAIGEYLELPSARAVVRTKQISQPQPVAFRFTLKKGDTICKIAREHSDSWRKLYQENEARLEKQCLDRHPDNPSRCRNGQWQYRMAVGDYVESPRLLTKAAPAKRYARTSVRKLEQVETLRGTVTEKTTLNQALNLLDSIDVKTSSFSREPLPDTYKKVERKVPVPVPQVEPEDTPAAHEENEDEKTGRTDTTVPESVLNNEVNTLERCANNSVARLFSFSAGRVVAHREMYLMCLKSGAVSRPLFLVEVEWLKGRKTDMIALVGETPIDMVCSIYQNCSRPHAWLRI